MNLCFMSISWFGWECGSVHVCLLVLVVIIWIKLSYYITGLGLYANRLFGAVHLPLLLYPPSPVRVVGTRLLSVNWTPMISYGNCFFEVLIHHVYYHPSLAHLYGVGNVQCCMWIIAITNKLRSTSHCYFLKCTCTQLHDCNIWWKLPQPLPAEYH